MISWSLLDSCSRASPRAVADASIDDTVFYAQIPFRTIKNQSFPEAGEIFRLLDVVFRAAAMATGD